ncbi:MAG: hypothetical protein U1E70_29820 [Acetobacteraceae bacterium]
MQAAYDHLLAILITFLTPLFLGGASGNSDLAAARAAAVEAVESFRPRNAWELLTTVQVVAFSIAALGSIGMSLDDTLSASGVLRCRSNANALQRTADKARDRLEKRRAQPSKTDIAPMRPEQIEATLRQAAAAQRAAAEARAALEGHQPPAGSPVLQALADVAGGSSTASAAADPMPAIPPSAARGRRAMTKPASAGNAATAPHQGSAVTEAGALPPPARSAPPQTTRPLLPDRHQVAWATAMANVAAELTRDLDHLPPAEQRLHRLRVDALTQASQRLTRGGPPDLPPGFPGLRPPHRATVLARAPG